MEFVKSEVIIDPDYQPSLKMSYMEYFTRALNFAQTNYPEQLTKLANLHFSKLVPTTFFESYAWTICNIGLSSSEISELYPQIRKEISYFYPHFDIGNNSSKQKMLFNKIFPVIKNSEKCQALCQTAYIMGQGIKLFGWARYRNNFLSTLEKLQALPLINKNNSLSLGFDIGYHKQICNSGFYLQKMITCWNFQSVEQMCDTIAERVVLQPRVIGLILWYAGYHFGTIIANP
jgi:hypothetical protein